MKLYNMFDISLNENENISIIGAGGKTTTLFELSKELRKEGKKVLVTTTTAIFYPEKEDYDNIFIDSSSKIIDKLVNIKKGSVTIIGREVSKENKLLGIKKEFIEQIYDLNMFDYIIVEADGAKRKSIKCPADHEPVIPDNTTKTIGVIGLDALGLKINNKNVHRPELFCNVTDSKMEDIIDEYTMFKLISNKKGLFKGVPKLSKKYVLLNKIDDDEKRKKSSLLIADLLSKSSFKIDGLIAGSTIETKNEQRETSNIEVLLRKTKKL